MNTEVSREQVDAVLSAQLPDGCTVQDYLEDAIPNEESLAELGISTHGAGFSYVRSEMHDDFYVLLITAILNAGQAKSQSA